MTKNKLKNQEKKEKREHATMVKWDVDFESLYNKKRSIEIK